MGKKSDFIDALASLLEDAKREPTVVFWRNEYKNVNGSGNHWGKVFKSEANARKYTSISRYIRTVKFGDVA